MSMMVSFVLSFFPRDVLDEILNLIESVSEDFPSYSYVLYILYFPLSCWFTMTSLVNETKIFNCIVRLTTAFFAEKV